MNREQISMHSLINGAKGSYGIFSIDIVDTESDVMQLLRLIYNDADGNLRGDIAAFLSEKTSPEIRDFIRQNIFGQPVSRSSNIDGVSDETIAEFTRDADESIYDYKRRVQSLFEKYGEEFSKVRKELDQK